MGLHANSETFVNLQIEGKLAGVIKTSEATERRPFASLTFWTRAEIALEDKFAANPADAQFVRIWIEQFYPVPRTLGERETMPSLLHRSVFSRLTLAAPAWDFELRPSQTESRRKRAIFHLHHWLLLELS